ncbi:hypothetical protein DP120_08705 [Planococcus halotolerans]|uniref:Uncharacterized protein n=1 Tax=Planococcus halotolerans TaxID=2233542 RepID=A0A365L2K1_9BACL|nr:hypothetical protein DP120_08705 [Planococcus halotolerans]
MGGNNNAPCVKYNSLYTKQRKCMKDPALPVMERILHAFLCLDVMSHNGTVHSKIAPQYQMRFKLQNQKLGLSGEEKIIWNSICSR